MSNSGRTITVCLEELEKDAVIWDGVGDKSGSTSQAVASMIVGVNEFSSMVGGEVATAYETARAHAEKLCDAGASQAQGVARVLRKAKEGYAKSEGDAIADLNLLQWEPVP